MGSKPVTLCKVPEMGGRAKNSVTNLLPKVVGELEPISIIELGICFGLKEDVKVGDVCVSTFITDYEFQKVNPDEAQFRSRSVEADSRFLGKITKFNAAYKKEFGLHMGGYACGEKVVNSDDFKASIKRAVPDAKFADMESYVVARMSESIKIPWMIIKGSSDDGVNKGDEFQKLAAENAVSYFVDLGDSGEELQEYLGKSIDISDKYTSDDYRNISKELFKEAIFKSDPYRSSRLCFDVHHHPQMEGLWASAYIYKSHSIPEALRTILKQFKKPPAKLDVCVISRDAISDQQRGAYERDLIEGGCQKVYVNSIKRFIFEKIVSQRFPKPEVLSGSDYIDQLVYKDGQSPVSGRTYTTKFLQSDAVEGKFKPICFILGQGGVGKTSLCNNIAKRVDAEVGSDRHLLVVTKHDLMASESNVQINSVVDLYRESIARHQAGPSLIDDAGFELALSCGSIVMVIDGIDEIESMCGGSFNLDSFVDSIERLGNILNSCKVICTSRDVEVDRLLSIKNADFVFLKGFDRDDVDKYLGKQEENVADKIREIMERIKGPEGFINPYLLYVAKVIFSGEDGDESALNEEPTSLNLHDPFEYMLWRTLKREISKQSLGIKADDYLELLESVVIEYANSMSRLDFDMYVNTMLSRGAQAQGTVLPEGYLKCFLFDRASDRVSVVHQEFVALILANAAERTLVKKVLNISDFKRLKRIYSSDFEGGLGIERVVIRRLRDKGCDTDNVQENIRALIVHLKEEAKVSLDFDVKKSIYCAHRFSFGFSLANKPEDVAEVLAFLHGGKIIKNLYILGDFPVMDLSGFVVINSEFSNFTKFFTCKFNEQTSFRSCSFFNCSSRYNKSSILPDIFDQSCRFDDAMRSLFSAANTKRDDRLVRLRSDTRQILKAMRQGLTFRPCSLNRIKMASTITSELGYEAFLEGLCAAGLLHYDSGSQYYEINHLAESDAVRLCDEDHASGSVSKAIATLAGGGGGLDD